MKFRRYLAYILLIISIVCLSYSQIMAFDTSQKLLYEGSYILNQDKYSNSLSFNIDYFHELTNDVFLEGDLVIRTSNAQYGDPLVIGPNEIYLSAYSIIKNLDLEAGKIITRWGAADIFSPLDNFNPEPPGVTFIKNQNKLGLLGINASYYISDLTLLQVVLVPRLEVTPYPDQYLKDNYLTTYGPIFQAQGYTIDSVDLSYNIPESVIWGLRLNHSFSSFDTAISYYKGYYRDPFPADLKLIAESNKTSIKINLDYPGKQVLGLEFQGEFPGIEGATLRGDLAYIIPEQWSFQEENILDHSYLKAIISADYTTENNLYLNGGFIYGMTFERSDDCSPYLYLNTNQELGKNDLKPFYSGILSLEDMSMGNILGIDYQISESVSTSLYYLFLSGNSETNLGILKNSEGFYFSIEWLF